jgi:transposase
MFTSDKRSVAMTTKQDSSVLKILHPICCGLDVHKKSISASLLVSEEGKDSVCHQEVFGTFTDDLFKLGKWLAKHRCPIVAVESTGVYWKAVHNILERDFIVVLVNARHIKNLPGRKTDMSDSHWIASLLRVGLLHGSFIPPSDVRDWRDLSRERGALVHALGDAKRQVHKLFQCANIKVDSVVTDLFGKTGRSLMSLLLEGPDHITLKEVEKCARGKLKSKAAELYRAVQGFFTDAHRWRLREHLDRIAYLERQIARFESRLEELLSGHEEIIERLVRISGISYITARAILSEVGSTLEAFACAAALCSWAGLCPGNNESAGKRRNTKSPVRRHHLRTILVEAAWSAIRVKGSYYRAKYFALRSRMGPKKAIMVIAHKLLKAVYYVIRHGASFVDLGEEYLLELRKESHVRFLNRQANKLGFVLVPEALWQAKIQGPKPLFT